MGRISKSLKAIVIDAGVGAHSGITYVAKFDENHYEVLPIDGKEDLFNEYVVESKDVNEDGIIEFVRTVRQKVGKINHMVIVRSLNVTYSGVNRGLSQLKKDISI